MKKLKESKIIWWESIRRNSKCKGPEVEAIVPWRWNIRGGWLEIRLENWWGLGHGGPSRLG